MRYPITIMLCSLLFASPALAQHFISGTWTGNYSKGFLTLNPNKLRIDLNIYDDSLVTGSSHLYYSRNHYEHYTISGTWHAADSTILISEDSTLGVHLALGASNCTGDYKMKLKILDTVMRLEGRWSDNHNKILGCGSTGVWLEKPIKKKPKPAIDCFAQAEVDSADRNLARKIQVQSLIELDDSERDSIKIEVLDNAQVDNDMISLYLNDCQLLRRHTLAVAPHVIYLSIPKGIDICNLKMAAENMGSLPPCTALMRITTRKRNYEINLSSTMSNNSVLQLFVKN